MDNGSYSSLVLMRREASKLPQAQELSHNADEYQLICRYQVHAIIGLFGRCKSVTLLQEQLF
jgi:hypothetical protein